MKKILFVTGICLFSTFELLAQSNVELPANQTQTQERTKERAQRSPDEIATMRTTRLDKIVELNEEQKTKIKAIFLKEAQENKGRAMQNKETHKAIESILTETQIEKLKAVKQERMERIKSRKAQREGLKTAPSDSTNK